MKQRGFSCLFGACVSSIAIFLLSISVSAQTYTVGVEDQDYLPHYYFSGDKPGPLRKAMQAFAKHEGIQFEYVLLPVRRVKSWYSYEKIDFKLPDNPF